MTYIWYEFTGYIVFMRDSRSQMRCCGLISHWEFNATKTGQIRFGVWRQINNNRYEMVGENVVDVNGESYSVLK